MLCEKCRTEWPKKVKFCPNCGIKTVLIGSKASEPKEVLTESKEVSKGSDKGVAFYFLSIGLVALLIILLSVFIALKNKNADLTSPSGAESNYNSDQTQSQPAPSATNDLGSNIESPSQTPAPSFSIPSPNPIKAKTLNEWLASKGVDKSFSSIKLWTAQYRSINTSDVKSALEIISNARSKLYQNYYFIQPYLNADIPKYDKSVGDLYSNLSDFLDATTEMDTQVNNYSGDSAAIRQLLDDRKIFMKNLNVQVTALEEYLSQNGNQLTVEFQ